MNLVKLFHLSTDEQILRRCDIYYITYIFIQWNIIQPQERRKSCHLTETWMDFEGIMLNEIN